MPIFLLAIHEVESLAMIVEKEYREGKTSFVSADVEHYSERENQPTTDMPVFYNPRMSLNRDFSVLFLSTYLQDNDVDLLCEPLAGCGVRTLRYLNECPGNFHALMFDANPNAIETIHRNIASNKMGERATAIKGDAKVLLLTESRGKRFDVVDIDPFGTPTPYLNAAIQALQPRGGILALTATDMPALCGVYPSVALRKYGGFSIRAPFSHELAVRLLLGQTFSVASANDCSISPLAVLSSDHYIRVWTKVTADRTAANRQAEEIGAVRYCRSCMHSDRFSLKASLTNPEFEHRIKDCNGRPIFAGPLWLGNLYDKEFLKKAETALEDVHVDLNKKVETMLSMMIDESDIQDWMYTDLHALCDLHGLTPPKSTSVINGLVDAGFRAVRTPFRPTAIRTDAPVNEVVAMIEQILGAEE